MKTVEQLKAEKQEIGSSGLFKNPKVKRGFSLWIENGVWFTAPKVSGKEFGGHAYAGGGYGVGIRDCPCGCFMLSSSSGGYVDPFGPCPLNPKSKKCSQCNGNHPAGCCAQDGNGG